MKKLLEFLSIPFIFGEAITVYTLIGCVSRCAPFPEWFGAAWFFYSAMTIIGVLVGVAALVRIILKEVRYSRFRRCRRLGMVCIGADGRFYYENRGRR
jgi:hypothetical protein